MAWDNDGKGTKLILSAKSNHKPDKRHPWVAVHVVNLSGSKNGARRREGLEVGEWEAFSLHTGPGTVNSSLGNRKIQVKIYF